MTIDGAVVLRPEPGATATAARLQALGVAAIRLPLFAVRPLAWTAPDPAAFDAVLFTSANAPRHGGEGLAQVRHLPAIAVGAATAAAARDAGFAVAATGEGDAAAALAGTAFRRPLHLSGADHRAVLPDRIAVYTSEALALAPATLAAAVIGRIALLHSPRAARRLSALVDRGGFDRARMAIGALSPSVLDAAGSGWAWSITVERPDDAALVAAVAERLTDPRRPPITAP